MTMKQQKSKSGESSEAPPDRREKIPRTWRTRKWEITRQRLIDATLDCIVVHGYHRTTLAEIAKKAGVTRGSVQYYFPTAPDAFRETIRYLHAEWLSRYAAAIAGLNDSKNVLEDGVQLLWRLLQDPLNIAWQELRAASRTDAALAEIIDATFAEIERTRKASDRDSYSQLSVVDPAAFELASDFTNVFMEGLSLYPLAERGQQRKTALMALLVRFLGGFWREAGLDSKFLGEAGGNISAVDETERNEADAALSLIHKLEPIIRRLAGR